MTTEDFTECLNEIFPCDIVDYVILPFFEQSIIPDLAHDAKQRQLKANMLYQLSRLHFYISPPLKRPISGWSLMERLQQHLRESSHMYRKTFLNSSIVGLMISNRIRPASLVLEKALIVFNFPLMASIYGDNFKPSVI